MRLLIGPVRLHQAVIRHHRNGIGSWRHCFLKPPANTKELFYVLETLESRHGRPHSAPAVCGTSTFEAPSIGGYPTRIQSPRRTTNPIERQLWRPLAGASSETFRACQLFITAARTTTRMQHPPRFRSSPQGCGGKPDYTLGPPLGGEERGSGMATHAASCLLLKHFSSASSSTGPLGEHGVGSSPPRHRGPGRCGRRSPQMHASRQAMARHLSMRQGPATLLAAGYGALRDPRPQPLDLRVTERGVEDAGGEACGPYNIIRGRRRVHQAG
ncbi:hypothetical protein FB451DRAFT_1184775 [Mycena latifolia]|nr:hypothetical protein FB451DRAFT_1184775 [Mycena latifolia]